MTHQSILSEQVVAREPTEIHYLPRFVSQKHVHTQNDWNSELDVKTEIDVPIHVIVGFQERVWRDKQEHKIDIFVRLFVSCAQGVIGNEKYPDAGIRVDYDDDIYSKVYGNIVS